MALDEAGWTGRGKGDVERLSERRILLSSSLVEITWQPVEYGLLHDGEYYYVLFAFFQLNNVFIVGLHNRGKCGKCLMATTVL